jgi:hypothetical protein
MERPACHQSATCHGQAPAAANGPDARAQCHPAEYQPTALLAELHEYAIRFAILGSWRSSLDVSRQEQSVCLVANAQWAIHEYQHRSCVPGRWRVALELLAAVVAHPACVLQGGIILMNGRMVLHDGLTPRPRRVFRLLSLFSRRQHPKYASNPVTARNIAILTKLEAIRIRMEEAHRTGDQDVMRELSQEQEAAKILARKICPDCLDAKYPTAILCRVCNQKRERLHPKPRRPHPKSFVE